MAKKKASARKKAKRKAVSPTFEVRFIGPGVSPELVSLSHVSEALSAIQDLAAGRDRFETAAVPPEKGIGLVDVEMGSAVYKCFSRFPSEALSHFRTTAKCLEGDKRVDPDAIVAALSPIEDLSRVARLNGCRVEVRWAERGKRETLFGIEGSDYDRLSKNLLIEGETSVAGTLQRIGGATETRCALRVEGRRPLLFCDVAGDDLARRLGQHLYEDVVVTGTAIWLHRSWRIYSFRVTGFSQPRLGKTAQMVEELRDAGLDAWDDVDDPAGFVEELRS